jgi:hypothetical protein
MTAKDSNMLEFSGDKINYDGSEQESQGEHPTPRPATKAADRARSEGIIAEKPNAGLKLSPVVNAAIKSEAGTRQQTNADVAEHAPYANKEQKADPSEEISSLPRMNTGAGAAPLSNFKQATSESKLKNGGSLLAAAGNDLNLDDKVEKGHAMKILKGMTLFYS